MMLWEYYIYRRDSGVHELWDLLFKERQIKLLYITGKGFDTRTQAILQALIDNLNEKTVKIVEAKLVFVELDDYDLDEDLKNLTEENATRLESIFESLTPTAIKEIITLESPPGGEDINASVKLREKTKNLIKNIEGYTDLILDVSSLPKVEYLAFITNILEKIVPDKSKKIDPNPLHANGVNFQVVVAEDAELDGQILAEDPGNDLVSIPGYTSIMHAESFKECPLVWLPILGENRVDLFEKTIKLAEIPEDAEICPVLPHPSRNPRRADNLLIEYKVPLFDSRSVSLSNFLYVHESNPFETYRQLLRTMTRYKKSMEILGGCRIVVTPLSSKLMTIGAGLACFEMKPTNPDANYGVAIPHAVPKKYSVNPEHVVSSKPTISSLLLTGESYSP